MTQERDISCSSKSRSNKEKMKLTHEKCVTLNGHHCDSRSRKTSFPADRGCIDITEKHLRPTLQKMKSN